MSDFVVRYVDEEALPADQPWVIGVTTDGTRFIFMKQGARECPTSWEEVWRYGHMLNAPALPVAV